MILLSKHLIGVLLSLVLYNVGLCDQMVTDTFNNSPEKRWIYFADTVMGGQSSGSVDFKETSQVNYARLIGNVTTENNGGFIQIRKKISGLDKNIVGIKLRTKGNNQIYHVFIRTSGTILPWQYYKAEFSTKKSWKTIKIPIEKFERSGGFLSKRVTPETIKSVGLVAFGRDFKADLFVSEVSFY